MNDLDELMSRDPLSLSAQDIDNIIKYHRNQRARRAAGEKPTKPKIDLSAILKQARVVAVPAVTIKRRF